MVEEIFRLIITRFVKLIKFIVDNGMGSATNIVTRYVYYSFLRAKYGFEEWHLVCGSAKDYTNAVIDLANEVVGEGCLVEVGCGFGYISSQVNASVKICIDQDERIVAAARVNVFRDKSILFLTDKEEFVPSCKGGVLILSNFLGGIDPEETRRIIIQYTEKFSPRFLLVDRITGSKNHYNHPVMLMTPSGYLVKNLVSGFKLGRELIVLQQE